MSNLEDSVRILSDFGLTPYEAKIYLTVVQLGLSSAGKIAKAAKVRREEVYRTLPKLEKAGLIERVLGRPIQVRALPLDDVLTILIERKRKQAEREISELRTKREELLRSVQQTTSTHIEEESTNFVLVSERDALAKRTEFLISKTQGDIIIVDTGPNIIRFFLNYGELLGKAANRGVRIRVITESPDDEKQIPDTIEKAIPSNKFILRYTDSIPSRYIIFDDSEVLITTSGDESLVDSKYLWTDDSNLVGIMMRDFENQLQTSVDWSSYTVSPSMRMTRILERLKPRDHVVLFYDSIEAKRWVLFNYIKDGLEIGHAARYVCSEETPDEIRLGMETFGIDVQEYERTSALGILYYDEIYIRDGKFNIDDVLGMWGDYYDDAIAKGFKGMRVTGEMGCFIEHSLVQELIEYEKALHTILDIPMTAICAYRADMFTMVDNPVDIYSELVRAHGKVLFAEGNEQVGTIEIRKS